MPEIADIQKEYDELLNQLSDPELISDWPRFEELSKKKKSLEKILEKSKEIEEISRLVEESKAILSANEDSELVALAESEMSELKNKQENLKKDLEKLLAGGDDEEEVKNSGGDNSVILEIRGGTGGDEAALFAGDLFGMYSRYAGIMGWKVKVLDSHPTELHGYKEIIFEIKGDGSYDALKNEAGVHRVQRIPETEKAGRVHTSTATVAVLLKPKPAEIKINPADLKIDIAKASGPGGQNVNKRMTAVRITHIPTGIMVKSMAERTLPQNKENALAILSARLLEIKLEEEEKKETGKRNEQIGGAKRAEKIRTYNFPQDRVTDHRIKKSWHSIEEMMEGKIDKMIKDVEEGLK